MNDLANGPVKVHCKKKKKKKTVLMDISWKVACTH